MPSTINRDDPKAGRSLAYRVALGTAVSASIVAILSAAISLFVADRLVRDGEDSRLRAAASTFAAELPLGRDRQSIVDAIAQEQTELAPASIRISVTRDSLFIGGDAHLPVPARGACESRDARDTTIRVCAIQSGSYGVVTGSTRPRRGAPLVIISGLFAAACAAALAALLGRRSAKWALEPLTQLRQSLDRIAAEEPRRVVLGGDDACREVAAMRDALDALLARLAVALDAAKNFSAEAAHELRTPLTVIQAELELIAEESELQSTTTAVEKVRERVLALVTLTERLLALATTTEHLNAMVDAVAVEDVATDVITRRDQQSRVRLHADVPGMVRGDETLLSTLFENAIDNALKFSGDKEVDIHVYEQNGRVVVDIDDRGPGFESSDRVRAFEPFFRSPAARGTNVPGFGIGLALVARIVAVHQGTVAFVDRDSGDKGARLRVELPVWEPRPQERTDATPAGASSA